jgi:pyruvate,water dikinase
MVIKDICDRTININELGNKARNILLLHEMGFPVAKSWIIESNYPVSLLRIEGLYRNGVSLSHFKKVRHFFLNEISNDAKLVIYSELCNCLEPYASYAIRSSSCLEDDHEHTYAGLYTTFLNVKKKMNIINCILKIWGDCFSEKVYEMCLLNGIKKVNPCAILIQKMISTNIGGVALGFDNKAYICAAYGQTKGIVDGNIASDKWIIERNSKKVIDVQIRPKTKALYLTPYRLLNSEKGYTCICQGTEKLNVFYKLVESGRLMQVDIPKEKQCLLCVDDEQVVRVLTLIEEVAKKIECMSYDVEWAIDNNMEIYILQIRALTSEPQIQNLESPNDVMPISGGKAYGMGIRVSKYKDLQRINGESIVIAKDINGPVLSAFSRVRGYIIESDSIMSHGAIIARELGLPCIAVKNVSALCEGYIYEIDGTAGYYAVHQDYEGIMPINSNKNSDFEEENNIPFELLLSIPNEWKETF